jgi:hypothetical protein
MNAQSQRCDTYEISPRFRLKLEERIARLERDSAQDELMLAMLQNEDHIRRHRRLVIVQQAEALRMRLFLDRTRTRGQRPMIAL